MTRARHERQILLNSSTFGREFEQAVHRVISRHRGMDFFTDEQIAEIRAELIDRHWFSHKLTRANRKRRAA